MKVVYDTCLYIDFLRYGRYQEIFETRTHIRYLSPLVMMELRAGARLPEQIRVVDKLFDPYSKASRIIELEGNVFYKAGETLAKMGLKKREVSRGFTHDLLIAYSALSIGATLYTKNKKDFQFIRKFIPVKTEFVMDTH